MKRRSFLGGIGGALGALALGPSRISRLAHSDPSRPPLRLLVIYKPLGTQPEAYNCVGSGRDFTLSPILQPFADLREHMVIVDGLDVWKKPNTPGEDHGNGIVTFMTGGITYKADASGIPLAERISIDQILANHDAVGRVTPIRSLQVAADARSGSLFTRILSYSGKGAPMPAEHRPLAAYARVFGSLADRTMAPGEIADVRRRHQSILDFSREGLRNVRERVGGEERQRLDRHLQAIRELERVLDQTAGVIDTAALEQQARAADIARMDASHGELGRAHLDIVRAAFRCDLTRLCTFAWAGGGSFVNFSKIIPGIEDLDAHNISHSGVATVADEIAIHTWYNEQMAAFIRSLRDTLDVDGSSLLDNMLIVVWSEMGRSSHSFESVPVQLFGGAGGRLSGGRLLRYDHRPTNDLWLSIADQMGVELDHFGDAERCMGRLPDLFAPSSAIVGTTPTSRSR